jgi:hypothetical protein
MSATPGRSTLRTVAAAVPVRGPVGVDSSSSATRTVVATFGLVVAMAGMEHGIGEILQGPVAPPDLVFQSWPDTPGFAILNGEPALTVIPNLAVTGVLAVAASVALAVWVVRFAHRGRGPLVLLVLSVVLLLVGGGLFPPLIGILLAVAAARIGVAGREPGQWARRAAPAWSIALAVGVAGYLALFPGMVLASSLFGVASDGFVLLFAGLAFGGLISALGTARAYDWIAADTDKGT